jgi:sec-independent protein translocase protein TatA
LFGAKRLPDAARSLGRSLRIIKAETKGLVDDDNNVAEKAEPPYSRQPLHPTEIHQPGQPGYQQAPPPGYQQQPGYQQPNGQQYPQPQQPPAQPYVDPVQRTNDR